MKPPGNKSKGEIKPGEDCAGQLSVDAQKLLITGSGGLSTVASVIGTAANLVGRGGQAVTANLGRWIFRTDNSGIDIRRGRKSSALWVCGEARRLLKNGYPRTKTDLAEHLSGQLARHYPDKPQMGAERVERVITPVWRELRPDRSRK